MPQLIVDVKNRIATGNKKRIVCGNSGYIVKFNFDEEWDAHDIKTAVFRWGKEFKEHEEVPFVGSECEIPKIFDTAGLKIGVFAGDLTCTTPAYFGADPCILCGDEIEEEPSSSVYNKLIDIVNQALVSNKGYVYEQSSASDEWIIKHNMDRYPSVTIVDSANNVVVGDVCYLNSNELIVSFTGVFSGKAYLN